MARSLKPGLATPLACIAVFAVFSVMSSPAEAACFRQGSFRLTSEGPWPLYMTVNSGERCQRFFRLFGNITLKRLYAIAEPANGRLDLIEGGRYAYTSKPGFRGKDSFTLRLCGISGATREACASLQHEVSVK